MIHTANTAVSRDTVTTRDRTSRPVRPADRPRIIIPHVTYRRLSISAGGGMAWWRGEGKVAGACRSCARDTALPYGNATRTNIKTRRTERKMNKREIQFFFRSIPSSASPSRNMTNFRRPVWRSLVSQNCAPYNIMYLIGTPRPAYCRANK